MIDKEIKSNKNKNISLSGVVILRRQREVAFSHSLKMISSALVVSMYLNSSSSDFISNTSSARS
jgi:hypothetical protein